MNDHQQKLTKNLDPPKNGTRNLHKQHISRSSGSNWNHPHFDSELIQFWCNRPTTSWFQSVPFWEIQCLWFGFCGHQGCIGRPQQRRLEGREGFREMMRGLYVAENEGSLQNEWSCYLPQVLFIFFSRGVPNFKFHQIPRKRTPPKTNSSHKPSRIHQTPQNGLENNGIPSKFPHRNALFDPQNGWFQDQTGGTSPSLRSFSPFFHGNQKGAPTIWPARQLREGSAWPFGRV